MVEFIKYGTIKIVRKLQGQSDRLIWGGGSQSVYDSTRHINTKYKDESRRLKR
jgi:hypothetical protein